MLDSQGIIGLYRGWHELEQANGIDIVDFDLIPEIDFKDNFNGREEVLERLVQQYGKISPQDEQEEAIKAKLNGSIYYLRALMGEEIPFAEYVENILGVKPQIIPQEAIEEQKQRLERILIDLGHNPRRETAQEFILSTLKVTREGCIEEANYSAKVLVPAVLETLGFQDLELDYETRFVNEEDYWSAWTSTKPDGSFLLRYNLYNFDSWPKGKIEKLTLHEVAGHFVNMTVLKKRIAKEELSPVVGLPTVQEPYAALAEGLADSLPLFIPEVAEKHSKYGLMAKELDLLGAYVLSNNGVVYVNSGIPVNDRHSES